MPKTRLDGILEEGPASVHILYLDQRQIMYAESFKLAPSVVVLAFREVLGSASPQTDTFQCDFLWIR